MKKVLTVQEYDKITCNEKLKNHKTYHYLDNTSFLELKNYIIDLANNKQYSNILNFFKISKKRNIGEMITIKNYIGVIQMNNGNQIQIMPKLNFDDDLNDDYKQTKKVLVNMLRSFNDFQSKSFSLSNIQIERMNLFEIFINIYLQEVSNLTKHGIKADYLYHEGNTNFYKGKLILKEQLRQNLTHNERFYVANDYFTFNRPENRIIKSTLLKLKKITTDYWNIKKIRQLLRLFNAVDSSINYARDLSQITINRTTHDYELLIAWSKVILLNYSFSIFCGNNKAQSILFPMDKLFESYVARQIKSILSLRGWKVNIQDSRYHLFSEPKKMFALRPDIVCVKDDIIIVMDTKWKKLVYNSKNYGISIKDMYQMYAYSKIYKAKKVLLLFPYYDEIKQLSNTKFISPDNSQVNLHLINLTNIKASLLELATKIERGS